MTFTVYEQSEPTNVVFLMGGTSTNDEYWFDDLSKFDEYKDTLFIGIGQSYSLKDDIGVVVNWVSSQYNLPDREQWSFFGFSLGAYQTISVALDEYHNVFGNYASVGGGMGTKLEDNPNICFMYIAYGTYDLDKSSAEFLFKDLKDKGFLTIANYKIHIIKDMNHSLKEAQLGLDGFLTELRNRNYLKRREKR